MKVRKSSRGNALFGRLPVTSALDSEGWTLSKVYRLALPAAREVPQVILDADDQRAKLSEQLAEADLTLPEIEAAPASHESRESRESLQRNDRLPTAALAGATACSPDVYNDNWALNGFSIDIAPAEATSGARPT
jgi:hypothetical protein